MIFKTIKYLIANQLDISEDKITLDSNIKNDFNFDSLDIAELIMNIEDEFKINISDDNNIFKCSTINEIVEFLNKKINNSEKK